MAAGDAVNVLVSVGAIEEQISALHLRDCETVTVVFSLGDSTVSLTFDAAAFAGFAQRLHRFANSLPGRPS